MITTDEGFKIRVYDAENFHNVKTFLGPVFGTAVKRFSLLHDWETQKVWCTLKIEVCTIPIAKCRQCCNMIKLFISIDL